MANTVHERAKTPRAHLPCLATAVIFTSFPGGREKRVNIKITRISKPRVQNACPSVDHRTFSQHSTHLCLSSHQRGTIRGDLMEG